MIYTPIQQTYTVNVSLWRQRYCDTNRQVQAFLTGHAPCAGKITLSYIHSSEGSVAFSASQRFEIAGIVLEPITAHNAPTVYNPSGIASNALAAFEIEVYPTSIPDNDITWSIVYGDVSFYNTGNKGRIVYVRGGITEAEFKLEADIAGVTLDPKPHIYGKTLALRSIPLYVFNICDTNGVLAVDPGTITQWVETANAIYKQAGMSFYITNLTTIVNQNWFEIGNSSTFFYQMTSYATQTGGLELYCVRGMDVPGKHSDMRLNVFDSGRGMAVRADASKRVLAHEIGHACLCMDVEYVFPNVVSETRIGLKNWSGDTNRGYYREGLTQADAVCRLLMYAYDVETAYDVPVDNIYGTVTEFGQTFESSKQCGLIFMDRVPQH